VYSLLGCEREGASELNQSRTGDYPELYTQWKAKRKTKSALKAIPETRRTTGWQVGAVEALRFACSEMRQRYTYESRLQGSGTNALLKNNQPE